MARVSWSIAVDSEVCVYRTGILEVEAEERLNGIGHFFCVDMGTLP